MIRRIILGIIANSAALYVIDYFISDFCFLGAAAESCPEQPEAHIAAYIVGGIILGVLNAFIKPILKLISMPFTFLTAGLFMFVINGILLATLVWLIQIFSLEGVNVLIDGDNRMLTYLLAAIVLGLFNLLTHWLVKKN